MIDEYELNADGLTESWGFPSLADSTSQQAGLLYSVETNSMVSAPRIENGVLQLPVSGGGSTITDVLYSSIVEAPAVNANVIVHPFAQTRTNSSSVAGIMSGNIKSSEVSSPYIENGNIILPYAQCENGSSVTGLIAGVTTSAVSSPIIQDGTLILPTSGTVLGLRDAYGNPIAWEDLPTAENAIVLSTHYVGSYEYNLKAYMSDGYLGLQIIQNFDS